MKPLIVETKRIDLKEFQSTCKFKHIIHDFYFKKSLLFKLLVVGLSFH